MSYIKVPKQDGFRAGKHPELRYTKIPNKKSNQPGKKSSLQNYKHCNFETGTFIRQWRENNKQVEQF